MEMEGTESLLMDGLHQNRWTGGWRRRGGGGEPGGRVHADRVQIIIKPPFNDDGGRKVDKNKGTRAEARMRTSAVTRGPTASAHPSMTKRVCGCSDCVCSVCVCKCLSVFVGCSFKTLKAPPPPPPPPAPL